MRMQKSKNLLLILGSEKVTTSNYTMLGSASKLKPLVSIRYLYILQQCANTFYQALNTTAPFFIGAGLVSLSKYGSKMQI